MRSGTSQVPERREGKTKVIGNRYLPFTVLKLFKFAEINGIFFNAAVATVLTVHGMRRRCETTEEQSDDEVRTSQSA